MPARIYEPFTHWYRNLRVGGHRWRFDTALLVIELSLIGLVLFDNKGNKKADLVVCVLLLAISLYGWLRSIRYARLIFDTPTSRVASAAQGYVELYGRGKPLAGVPLLSPVNCLPVLWYRLDTYERVGDKWAHQGTNISDASFLLDDGSGVCAVDPDGAQMLIQREDIFDRGDTRYVQRCLIQSDRIYVLGDFATFGSITPDFDTAAQVRELLADWKRNRSELLERFDLDRNGEIDLHEWELARAQARREVAQRQKDALEVPEAHVVRQPTDGRLYLISDLDPDGLARRYGLWAILHLTMFFCTLAAMGWLYMVTAP